MATAAHKGTISVALVAGLFIAGTLAAPLISTVFLVRPAAAGDAPGLVWGARALMALALAWLVIGMFAAQTSLVRRPGAAGARATWLSSSRPWRARESSLGLLPLDRALMFAIPAALLVGTRILQAELTSWGELLAVLAGWVVFAVVVRLLVGGRSPWPVIAAVGGGVVLHSILSLAEISFAGPDGWWSVVVSSPVLRAIASGVAFAATAWIFVAGAWALHGTFGARRAVGFILAGLGAGVAVMVAVLTAVSAAGDRSGIAWPVIVVAVLVAAGGVFLGISARRTERVGL